MSSSVHTQYASIADLAIHAPSAADHWLSHEEHETWCSMHSNARRATWLAGRMLAKQVLRDVLGSVCEVSPPCELHIETRSSTTPMGTRPQVFLRGRKLHCELSIAHTSRGVLVAVTTNPGIRLGVDLVKIDMPIGRSLAWCMTPLERLQIAAAPANDCCAQRLWAMKEALFKAGQAGEKFAPWTIDVPTAIDGQESSVPGLKSLHCWTIDRQIAAMAIVDRLAAMQDARQHRRLRSVAARSISSAENN